MSSGNSEQYRGLAEQVVRRAEQDEQFARQAKADPVGALTAAGVPTNVAQQMLQGSSGGEAEVDGHLRCADLTCWSSECPATCYVSLIGPWF